MFPDFQQQQGSYPPNQQGFHPQQPQFSSSMQANPQQQGYSIPPQQAPYNPQQTFSVATSQMDPEDPSSTAFQFDDQSIRKAFIRKVFTILSVSDQCDS